MYKRQRMSYDSQATQALSLSQITGKTKTYKKSPANPKADEFKGKAVCVNSKRQSKRSSLYDMLCPIYEIRRHGYGTAITGVKNVIGQTNSAAVAIGGIKKLANTPGQQNVYSFVHLPVTPYGVSSTGTVLNYQTGYALNELVEKAKDVNNFSLITAVDSIATAGNGTAPGLDPSNTDSEFAYRYGFTKHRFVNIGNTDAFVTIAVSRPRKPLAATMEFDNLTTIQVLQTDLHFPVHLSLVDKVRNQPIRNTTTPLYSTTATDAASDLAFRYTSKDDLRNFHYKTTMENFKLPPGETLTYTIQHGPFSFTDSIWDTFVFAPKNSITRQRPDFVPFCTVIMDVFVRGETVHNADESYVGPGVAQLTHEQTEYHNCRSIPRAPTKSSITIDDRIQNPVGPFFLISEDTEGENQMLS